MTAGQELRRLVEADLVEQQGIGRWTSYRLKVSPELQEQRVPQTDEDQILVYVQQHGSITNTECRELLNIALQRASYLLKKMAAEGLLKRDGERRWARYRFP